MSLGSTIITSIGLNISRFRAGINDAVTKAGEARKKIARQLEPIGGGAFLGKVGLAGLALGFMGVVKGAQRARDEAIELGKAIDHSTAAAAKLGDTFDAVSSKVSDLIVGGIGLLQRGIDEIALRTTSLFTGDNVEELREYMAENDRAAARRLTQIAEENKARREAIEYEKKALAQKEKAEDRIESARKKRAEMDETQEQKIIRLIKERDDAEAKVFDSKLSLVEQTEALAQKEELTNEIKKEQKNLDTQILAVQGEIASVQRERAQKAETSEEKINRLKQEQLDEMKKANDSRLTELERANAALRVEQLKDSILEEQNRTKDEMAEKDRVDKARQDAKLQTLRQQRDALISQRAEIERNIKEQEKQRLLPTVGEVASGERRIGGRAQQAAKDLDRVRRAEQRAADRVASEKENAQGATSEGAARDAERNRRQAQEQLDAAKTRRQEVENRLSGKVSDLGDETAKAQLAELEKINEAVQATSEALKITEAGN